MHSAFLFRIDTVLVTSRLTGWTNIKAIRSDRCGHGKIARHIQEITTSVANGMRDTSRNGAPAVPPVRLMVKEAAENLGRIDILVNC